MCHVISTQVRVMDYDFGKRDDLLGEIVLLARRR